MDGWQMNGDFETIWKEAVVAEVLYSHLPVGSEEKTIVSYV
jgi:hypothetical protein